MSGVTPVWLRDACPWSSPQAQRIRWRLFGTFISQVRSYYMSYVTSVAFQVGTKNPLVDVVVMPQHRDPVLGKAIIFEHLVENHCNQEIDAVVRA